MQKSKVVIETDALVAVAHREGIVSDKAETDAQLKILKAVTEKIPEIEEKRDAIIKQCDEIVAKATQSLAAAARSGMATSFSNQASEYNKPRTAWFCTFAASLIAIIVIGGWFLHNLPADTKGFDRLYYFLTEAPITLPFMWLTWFSAIRFSQLRRLKEDYKFKVVTALSLDGYRKQAEGLSKHLEEKLLDLAIINFGENPLRLMTKDSAKDAHPLAGVLNEKTIVELIRERLKAVLGGKPE